VEEEDKVEDEEEMDSAEYDFICGGSQALYSSAVDQIDELEFIRE
jgi:hypothetical protein